MNRNETLKPNDAWKAVQKSCKINRGCQIETYLNIGFNKAMEETARSLIFDSLQYKRRARYSDRRFLEICIELSETVVRYAMQDVSFFDISGELFLKH